VSDDGSGHDEGGGPSAGTPRVLHVIPSLRIGGTERQLVEFIHRSSYPAHHAVAVFDEEGSLAADLPSAVFSVGPFGRTASSYPRNAVAARRLRELIRGLRVDLVHAHLGVSEILAAAAVPRDVPIVASRRGRNVGFEASGWLKFVEGLGHRRVAMMICNSNYLAEYTRRHDRAAPPIRVIRNGVDLDRFRPSELPPLDPPTVTVVANLIASKGHEVLLRALALAGRQLPGLRAFVVGDGKERGGLVNLAADLGLTSLVTFAGQVPDPRPFVERAHVVALASSHEGFPNSLLEGMAMGRPVVATRAGGIPEMVRDGRDGLLVDRDSVAIAGAVTTLLGDPDRLRSMSASARERAGDFAWDRVLRETESVYQQVVREHRGGRGWG
jgi:glycosyltransferase involved in cell wall biosynthesis